MPSPPFQPTPMLSSSIKFSGCISLTSARHQQWNWYPPSTNLQHMSFSSNAQHRDPSDVERRFNNIGKDRSFYFIQHIPCISSKLAGVALKRERYIFQTKIKAFYEVLRSCIFKKIKQFFKTLRKDQGIFRYVLL